MYTRDDQNVSSIAGIVEKTKKEEISFNSFWFVFQSALQL